MSLIVQKFGGSSVADADRVRNVARIITETYQKGNSVVVVLSAQGDTTDDLIEKAQEINPHASKREMDMLLSTGEQISIALCAMCIEGMGYQVVSLTELEASKDEIRRQNEELHRLATRDPMTGCLNRRAFFDAVDPLYARLLDGGGEQALELPSLVGLDQHCFEM